MSKLNIITHQLKFDIYVSISQIWPFIFFYDLTIL